MSFAVFIHVLASNSMLVMRCRNWNRGSDGPCSETEQSKN